MRLVALVLLLAGCPRSVDYIPLASGKFTSDPRNTPDDLRGIELTLDLVHDRGELRDGASVYSFSLARHPDRETWHGGCGTATSYAKLEIADLSPGTFQLRGRTFTFKHVRAECAHWDGVWLLTDADRLIFSRP